MVLVYIQTAVYPGQRIELGLVGQDQFQNPTYFIARVSDSRDNINSGAFSQTDDDIVNSVNVRSPVIITTHYRCVL